MKLHLCLVSLAVGVLVSLQANAQSATSEKTEADCYAQQAALEKNIRDARSRGQMLRRRQLQESLDALRARCDEIASRDTHEARVMRQKNVVMQLRLDLANAEEELQRIVSEKKQK
ncbi:DUF1090 family protein [Variovorax sp. Sphag1AA]|uniref:DUF1090 family protein n=1 Tax=Variovorax sp. Sphag1AA TaxID=2587027 RepID=UPI00161161E1|nr:DUF1090 family protein [Variovorax sp. Sphag1AA]MBB3176528.1 hypothetical protein [Variovorax sp. Sphag1AA]